MHTGDNFARKRDRMSFRIKGQGATEYLVLLAVVLIIALVSIALLGFFPGLAGDARVTQSQSYWRGEAKPYAILESAVTYVSAAYGTVTLVMQNTEAGGTYTLNNLSVSSPTGMGTYNTSTTFASGEVKSISLNISNPGAAGSLYELNVNISYISPNGVTDREFGSKTLMGRYS